MTVRHKALPPKATDLRPKASTSMGRIGKTDVVDGLRTPALARTALATVGGSASPSPGPKLEPWTLSPKPSPTPMKSELHPSASLVVVPSLLMLRWVSFLVKGGAGDGKRGNSRFGITPSWTRAEAARNQAPVAEWPPEPEKPEDEIDEEWL